MKGIIIDCYQGNHLLNINQIFDCINYYEYQWMLSSYECNIYNDIPFDKEYLLISSNQLAEILSKNDQFIWAVFSGFNSTIRKEDIMNYTLTSSDSDSLWQKEISIQHPLAEIEIISWDSQYYIVISKNNNVIEKIRRNIPNCQDLEEYNQS